MKVTENGDRGIGEIIGLEVPTAGIANFPLGGEVEVTTEVKGHGGVPDHSGIGIAEVVIQVEAPGNVEIDIGVPEVLDLVPLCLRHAFRAVDLGRGGAGLNDSLAAASGVPAGPEEKSRMQS